MLRMNIDGSQAVLLGIIQGLSEFLPISSSGHLVLAPWLFGFSDPGLAFDVALHMGTLVAVVLFFWRDWLNVFHIRRDMPEYSLENPHMLLLLVVATIPGILAGVMLEKEAETIFRHPLIVASTLVVFGGLLFFADRFGRQHRSFGTLSMRDALVIGCSQALAIVPGVSRSGITITAALFRGLDRVSAARFSFLLSTPIIFGAAVSHASDFVAIGWNPIFFAGIVSSAVSGYFAIAGLLRFVGRVSYRVFFWYRLGLSLLITIFFFSEV